MPWRPLAVTGALAALDWGAWGWANSADDVTLGLIAGLLMAPIMVAFAWSLLRVVFALAQRWLHRWVADPGPRRASPESRETPAPFDIEAQDKRLAA